MKARTKNLPAVNGHLNKELKDFVYDFNKNPERTTLLVPKTICLKRKSKGNKIILNKDLIKKLEETISILEDKCKKTHEVNCFLHFQNLLNSLILIVNILTSIL